ncbi:hypothetical protein [Brevibacillus halotolerans]|uniref:hypothetical protein n=1 Tax=Brevibacillus halotolerans TaxID=1507437 RepID=UPI0015EF8486|nr:hypothetical protein [Brevibacillus halotolerans]MBA4534419.1 hypothetical protein [Brevibacillus halotolerans]
MAAHNLYLKNTQVYDDTGEVFPGMLEAKAVLKTQTDPVYRLRKGETEDIVSYHVEVSFTLTGQNSELKYFIIEQITQGKTPILPMLTGEQWDKENNVKEIVRLTNIRLVPEELTIFEAKAEGNDKAIYEIRGKTNDKPDFLEKFPIYED